MAAGFDGIDGTLQNFLRCETIGTRTVDQFRRRVVRNLLDERRKTILESIDEITMAAEDWIRIDLLDEIAGRIKRRFAPHVIQNETAFDASDFAAFHGMPAFDVVTGGQMADSTRFEFDVHRHGRPDRTARGLRDEGLDGDDIAAEMAHDIDGMRIQSLYHIERRTLVGVLDPHGHVDEKLLADETVVNPFLRDFRRFRETVVEVDAEATIVFFRGGDHHFRFGNRVADRLFAENMAARFKSLNGGEEMVGAVFDAAGGDGDDVWLDGGQHGWRIIKALHAKALRSCVATIFTDVANGDEIRHRIGFMQIGMAVPDGAAADDRYSNRCFHNGYVEKRLM